MPKKKTDTNNLLTYGIVFLSVALIFLSLYLLFRTKENNTSDVDSGGGVEQNAQGTKEEVYVDQEFGYSISYPPLLEPRSIEQENYLSLIIFFVPQDSTAEGFAISVRENTLDEETSLIKKEIESGAEVSRVGEEPLQIEGHPAVMLTFEPEDSTQFETKSVAILNNGKYSYAISSTPDRIEEVIKGFSLLND